LPRFLTERPIYGHVNRRFLQLSEAELREYLVRELERAGALKLTDGWLVAA
jgi:transcriptional regulator of NAD metabolism